MAEEHIKATTERRQRRERDAEAAREAIVNAARAAFVRYGYNGARVDEIARAAGYNKALIFHYFQDKLGLYQEVVGQLKALNFAQLKQNVSALIPDEAAPLTRQSVRDFLENTVRLTFDFHQQHPEIRRLLIWEAAEGWQTFLACHPNLPMQPWIEKIQHFIQRAQAAGLVRQDLDADCLNGNLMGMSLIFLASIPRYQQLLPAADFASVEGLQQAREQMAALVAWGAMTPDSQDTAQTDDTANMTGAGAKKAPPAQHNSTVLSQK